MIIGTVVVDLHLPGVNSLKEKRRMIKSIMARIKNRFNVSIAEVAYNDNLRMAQLGVAVVSNDNKFADQVIAKIVGIIDSHPDINMADYRMEML